MVIDVIKNAELYYGLGERIEKALRYLQLQSGDLATKKCGRYEVDGDDIYMLVQAYETKWPEACRWEAHRKYIDIQYVLHGTERMGFANLDDLTVASDYVADTDVIWFEGSGSMMTCNPGTMVLFMPQDAHMPCVAEGQIQSIKKVVVKVKTN